MALGILRGPAGAGKSQEIEPGTLRVDLTAIWVALTGAERGPDGKYPERGDADPALELAQYLKAAAVRQAARTGLQGVVTTSSSAPAAVERLREQGATAGVRTVDPGAAEVVERLADPESGQLSGPCRQAVGRWYDAGTVAAAESANRTRVTGVSPDERRRRRAALRLRLHGVRPKRGVAVGDLEQLADRLDEQAEFVRRRR